MKTRGLAVALGRAGNDRGAFNEKRALAAALGRSETWPAWLQGVCPGTPDEDRRGWDLVAETDVGRIGIQIKSTEKFLDQHRERYGNAVVLSVGAVSDRDLPGLIINSIDRARRGVMRGRMGAGS